MSASVITTESMLAAAGLPTNREPTHPGQVLLKEYLEPLGITQVRAAEALGIGLARLNEIVKGKRRVTEETALLLERFLGCPAATWLNLQHAYDLAVAIRELPPKRLDAVTPASHLQSA